MTTTLKEQAWQSGLVLLNETPEWNFEDWPPLEGGWRYRHSSVVLDHTDHNQEQTVVVLGGFQQGQGVLDSVLVLNLAESNKQWREGPPMHQKRYGHTAVVCNGAIYVMGGDNGAPLDCIEQIDANYFLQSSLTTTTTQDSHWTTLNCRLSTPRWGSGAVAVHNRYIVVMGGYNGRYLSSVDIIDTRHHTVTAGPSMNIPRSYCASAVIGNRIFSVGGYTGRSVEYLEFSKPGDNEETKKQTGLTLSSFSSPWMTLSDLVLSNARSPCAVAAVGSCLVVAGGAWVNSTVEVLDTRRNRVWNLPPFGNDRTGYNMVIVANQVAVIGGWENPSCATLPLIDKDTWCFRRLCEHQSNEWYHSLEGMGI